MERKKVSFEEFKKQHNSKKVTDYNNPKCIECNSCCGILSPISKNEFLGIKQLLKKDKNLRAFYTKRVKEFNEVLDRGDIDMTCVFSNPKSKRCMIYHNRPEVCRVFHCSPSLNKKPDVEKMTKHGVYFIGDLWGVPCYQMYCELEGLK